MIMFKNVYPREKYLKKIRPFYDSDIIKVITGIRRCGKSFILRSIMNELLERGIEEKQIIYFPLDRRGYKNIKTPEELELKIESMLGKEDKYYLINNKGKKVSEQYVRIMYLGEKYYAGYTTGSKYEVFDVEGNKVINDYFMDEGTTFVYNDVVYGIFNKSGSSYIYDMNENEVVFSVEGDLEFNEKGYFVTVDGDAYYSLKGEKIYKR